MPEKPVKRRLKLILPVPALFQTTASSFESCWRGSASSSDSRPTSPGGRGAVRGDEARSVTERRNEAIAEVTLVVAAVAMVAAIVAAVRG